MSHPNILFYNILLFLCFSQKDYKNILIFKKKKKLCHLKGHLHCFKKWSELSERKKITNLIYRPK